MITRQWFQVASVMIAIAANAALGSTAHASKIAQSMQGCSGVFIDTTNPGNNNGFGEYKVGNSNPNPPTIIACPVDNFSATPISTVTLDVFMQNNVAIGVQACVTFAGGFGGACGSPNQMQSSGGIKQLQPPLTAWTNHPTDYRWLLISINNTPPPGFNTLFGYRQD